MLSTFLIALREGLEATLIVGILLAYVIKTGRTHLLRSLWIGVSLAIAASLGLGAALNFTSHELSDDGEKIFAGTTSILAVALVTVMVFWMKKASRRLRDDLQGKLDASAISSIALALAVFFAVAREGLETALFIYSNFGITSGALGPSIGLIFGLISATALGYLIYRRALKFNIARFFTWTGVALIVVAAGVLSHGIAEFQEIGWLPGGTLHAWSIDSWMSEGSFIASLLSGSIGFATTTSWLQVGVWLSYLTIVLRTYLRRKSSPILATGAVQ